MESRIYFEVDVAAPQAKVWDTLTKPENIPKWWDRVHTVNLTHPGKGGVYTLEYEGGTADSCEIVELEPGKRLKYKWFSNEPEPTLVDYRLVPIPGGTRLCFTNEGLKAGENWDKFYAANFIGWLEMMLGVREMLDASRKNQ